MKKRRYLADGWERSHQSNNNALTMEGNVSNLNRSTKFDFQITFGHNMSGFFNLFLMLLLFFLLLKKNHSIFIAFYFSNFAIFEHVICDVYEILGFYFLQSEVLYIMKPIS